MSESGGAVVYGRLGKREIYEALRSGVVQADVKARCEELLAENGRLREKLEKAEGDLSVMIRAADEGRGKARENEKLRMENRLLRERTNQYRAERMAQYKARREGKERPVRDGFLLGSALSSLVLIGIWQIADAHLLHGRGQALEGALLSLNKAVIACGCFYLLGGAQWFWMGKRWEKDGWFRRGEKFR